MIAVQHCIYENRSVLGPSYLITGYRWKSKAYRHCKFDRQTVKQEKIMDGPRLHHYIFAHKAIPSLFFHEPEKFLSIMSVHADAFLRDFWNKVGESVDKTELVAADGLACEVRKIVNGDVGALITLPPPERITEAYFVAPVYRPQAGSKNGRTRFITLEYSPDRESLSVLCEWTAEGSHLNSGDGPEPKPEDFWKVVCTRVGC
jgi:hypothetical protein